MIHALTAHSSIILTWVVCAATLCGTGLLAVQRLKINVAKTDSLFIAFWLGFAILILYLQLWHFVLPVTWATALPPFFAGLCGIGMNHVPLRRWFTGLRCRPLLLLLVAIAMLWCANRATGPGNAHDSGLYHYNVIRWNNEHPIVHGLGNLHIRLAFNNSSLLYGALANTGPWAGRGNHVGNGLLLSVLMAQSLLGLARCCRHRTSVSKPDLFLAMLLPITVVLALSKEASSPKTDLPLAAIMFIGMWRLLALAGTRDASKSSSTESTNDFLLITTLASTATCLKLSGSVYGLVCWIAALAIYVARRPQAVRGPVLAAVLASSLLVGPWMARGVVMTGQPLFPTQIAPLDVPWRVPDALVDNELSAIAYFSRLGIASFVHGSLAKRGPTFAADLTQPPRDTDTALAGLGWVRPWFFSACFYTPFEMIIPLLIVLVSCIAGLYIRFVRNTETTATEQTGSAWVKVGLLVGPTCGVLFWFFTAPEARFGYGVLWTLAAVSAALSMTTILRHGSTRSHLGHRGIVSFLAMLCIIAAVHRAAINRVHSQTSRAVGPLGGVPLIAPGTDKGFHPITEPTMVPWQSRWGLTLQVPAGLMSGTTKAANHLTWDAPLPCTGYPHEWLRLRRCNELRSGFVIDPPAASSNPRQGPIQG